MVHEAHNPEWPDKVVFANMTVLMAGVLSLLLPIVSWSGGSIDAGSLVLFQEIPNGWTFTLGAIAVVLGAIGIKFQAWVWAAGGAVACILGMGFFGIPMIMALAAVGMLIKGAVEGEEMKHDDVTVAADEWPDKAIAASMLFFTLGIITLVQGLMIWGGKAEGFVFSNQPAIIGTLDVAIGIVCFMAARACFTLKTSILPWIAGVAGFIGFAFILLGPAIAAIAMAMLGMAEREHEFIEESPA